MSEAQGGAQGGNEGGAGASAVADALGAAGGAANGQDGGQGGADAGNGAAADRWQDKFLTGDLRNDDTLAAYKSIDDVAKALIETKKWARGRVAIPAADDAEGFAEFVSKVRPETPDAYKIAVPDGQSTELADQFRPIFHDAGLHPRQAEILAEKWNQVQADIVSKTIQRGKDELTAIELELGPNAFTQRLTAVSNMFRSLGLDADDMLPAMEQVHGAGKTMRALFQLAEKTGELAKVDGASVELALGAMTPQKASQEVDRMDADPEIRKRVADKNSPEYHKRQQLMQIIAKGA